MKKVLLEAALVTITGAALALAANAFSNRGLKLTRDYFPGAKRPTIPVAPAGTNATQTEVAEATARLRQEGLQVVDADQALQLLHDPRFEQGLVVFIDARNDEHFHEGHIPGAYQFDHYHPENYLATLLPICQVAQQIVVYCTGGDCHDSEFAALFLRDSAKIPADKLSVYAGGITEWGDRGFPVEMGERKSGQMRTASK